MSRILRRLSLPAFLLATACSSMPTGPSVMVLPGTGKNFDQFLVDDNFCRQFAFAQIGGVSPQQAAATSGMTSAAVGAALGAAAGAAIGGGQGAAVGAGTGLAAGGLAGTATAGSSGYEAQQRYDMGYVQCMYAKGHRVPISGRFMDESNSGQPSSSVAIPPPPPPGAAPPTQ